MGNRAWRRRRILVKWRGLDANVSGGCQEGEGEVICAIRRVVTCGEVNMLSDGDISSGVAAVVKTHHSRIQNTVVASGSIYDAIQ